MYGGSSHFPGILEVAVVQEGFETQCVEAVVERQSGSFFGRFRSQRDASHHGIEAVESQLSTPPFEQQRQSKHAFGVVVGEVGSSGRAGKSHQDFKHFEIVF